MAQQKAKSIAQSVKLTPKEEYPASFIEYTTQDAQPQQVHEKPASQPNDNGFDRRTRFSGIIPIKTLARANVAVIGTGAVGRQVAIQLAQIGVRSITAIDFDTVDKENLGPQGWHENEIGTKKVNALHNIIYKINKEIKIHPLDKEFEATDLDGVDWVFCAVDNMEIRKQVFNAAIDECVMLFAEARMGAEVCEAHFAYDEESQNKWLERWFPQEEAAPETCTTRATSHCASLAATLLMTGFTKMLRKHPTPQVVRVNLQSFDMEYEGMPAGETEQW